MALAILTFISLFFNSAFAGVHGLDERQFVNSKMSKAVLNLSAATGAMIPQANFVDKLVKNLVHKRNFCEDEPLAKENSVASCSGILIAPDKVLTTFHCVPSEESCKSNKWMFGLTKDKLNEVSSEDVYSCASIEKLDRNLMTLQDYTIIRLDRSVEGVKPVKVSSKAKIDSDSEVFMMGHPYGLAQMITGKSRILNNHFPHYFETELDGFSGNSGSPVFNAKTFELEGIFVRGGTDDYTDIDSDSFCRRWYECKVGSSDCESEDVTRIQSIPIFRD